MLQKPCSSKPNLFDIIMIHLANGKFLIMLYQACGQGSSNTFICRVITKSTSRYNVLSIFYNTTDLHLALFRRREVI